MGRVGDSLPLVPAPTVPTCSHTLASAGSRPATAWHGMSSESESSKKPGLSYRDAGVDIDAMDAALRKALTKFYPVLQEVRLEDYKVRILPENKGTAAVTRVIIESGDGETKWSTVGVSENILEASWQALVDSIEYKLLREEEAGRL